MCGCVCSTTWRSTSAWSNEVVSVCHHERLLSGRVKGNITSILIEDELVKVSLSPLRHGRHGGLYVPNSQFRNEQGCARCGVGNLNMNTGSYGNSLSQWGMQAATNAYQKTSNAIGKAIKNKVKLKYGTFVYLVNGREKQ